MSTAISTHRFSDPLAMAAAVVVIVGGASVIGVAAFQGDATTTAPPASTQGQAVVPNPPSRIGQGDFTQNNAEPNRGDYAAPPQGGAPDNTGGDTFVPPSGGRPMVGTP
jgi:hypothetical protein